MQFDFELIIIKCEGEILSKLRLENESTNLTSSQDFCCDHSKLAKPTNRFLLLDSEPMSEGESFGSQSSTNSPFVSHPTSSDELDE
jgi:hypothetical protein